jgi:hypothetical protein
MNLEVLKKQIPQQIFTVRGHQVMLDCDLACFYDMTTANLNKAVKRNIKRFPDEFVFQLTAEEFAEIRPMIVLGGIQGWGGRRSLPYAYTREGVAMISSILNSDRAIQAQISILIAFSNIDQRRTVVFPVEIKNQIQRIHDLVELLASQTNNPKHSKENTGDSSISLPMRHIDPQEDKSRSSYKAPNEIKVESIQKMTARYFNVDLKKLKSHVRDQKIVLARHLAVYLIRSKLLLSYKEIGSYFGEIDHSTVMHACQKIRRLLEKDLNIKAIIQELDKLISSEKRNEV